MLAPDTTTSQQSMQSGINAAQAVTQNSQAVITLVPAYYATLTGQWASLKPTLQGVVNDAETWPDSLCAAYTTDVPNLFISYNTTFQQNANNLLIQVNVLNGDPNNAAAKSALTTGLQSLTTTLESLQAPVTTLQTQLVAFQQTLQTDWNTLNGIVTQLSENQPGAGVVIESLSATLSVTFYESNMFSPCVAIVMINASTQTEIKSALNTQPEVVPVVMEQALLNTLLQQNQSATAAMSDILDSWSTLIGKYQAVIDDLQQAEGAPSSILEQLDIQNAQTAWSQLAAFAQSLAPTS